MLTYFIQIAAVIFVFMTTAFVVAFLRKRNDVADIAWGIGFIIVAYTSILLSKSPSGVQYLLASLTTLWGLRLAVHIYMRNRNKEEDFRYKAWREDWGKWWVVRSYLQVFLLQGFLLIIVVSPVILTINQPVVAGVRTIFGLALWLLGFIFEAVGDYQLSQFIKNPNNKGKIMNLGLWKFTRHPNYFGEITMWWAIFIIAFSGWYSLLGIVGPALITFLIIKVSGIPLLEEKYKDNIEYQKYASQTSILIPWPVKK